MAPAKAKVLEYVVEVGVDGTATVSGVGALEPVAGFSPDHLLLVALVRCSIESLTYHARLSGSETRAAGSAHGRVTRRESDGRYALVEIACRIEASLTPPTADPAALAGRAEWDCFVGSSLAVRPRYDWILDGNQVASPR